MKHLMTMDYFLRRDLCGDNYVNGEKQDDTFTIKVKGVPQKYFNFVLIDGNNFTIENLKQYQINPLEIECIDDITGNKINKKIWLGGNW